MFPEIVLVAPVIVQEGAGQITASNDTHTLREHVFVCFQKKKKREVFSHPRHFKNLVM